MATPSNSTVIKTPENKIEPKAQRTTSLPRTRIPLQRIWPSWDRGWLLVRRTTIPAELLPIRRQVRSLALERCG